VRIKTRTLVIIGLIVCFGKYDGMAAVKADYSGPIVVGAVVSAAKTKVAASSSASKKKAKKPAAVSPPKKTARTKKWYLTFPEIEKKGIYPAIESYMYRMCLQEVPLFLALHKCFYKDDRMVKGDTLVLKKQVLQALLLNVASHLGTSDLNISPVTNLDSMMLFRNKGQNPASTNCNIIIYTQADAYEIPKTGARIQVPAVIRGAIACNASTGKVLVAVFSKGVRLELPGYAKILTLGAISDMDIGFAELIPSESSYEARLLYATKEKDVKRRGWSFNITECNKIRPYAK
jgi:hypothetical protein